MAAHVVIMRPREPLSAFDLDQDEFCTLHALANGTEPARVQPVLLSRRLISESLYGYQLTQAGEAYVEAIEALNSKKSKCKVIPFPAEREGRLDDRG